MKKNLLYALVACLAFTFAACSDDPLDATSKHVYGPDENPYLKTNTAATISTSQEFPMQRINVPQEIKLADYAETFQAQLGMTVDEVVSGLSSGSVVFCPINMNLGQWMRNTAPTKGTYGWHYNSAGGLCDASSGLYCVEFDAAKKAVVVTCNSNIALGNYSFNVGFAIDNGVNFDDYVRISNSFVVSDPSTIIASGTLPAGDYAGFTIEFAKYKKAIETCTGMTLAEFGEAVQNKDVMALYLVENDVWREQEDYTANGLGYWLTADAKVTGWGNNSVFFIETTGAIGITIGRYPGMPSGTKVAVNFVYVVKADPTRYIKFIVTGTMA